MNVNDTISLDKGLPFNSRIPVRVPMCISKAVLVANLARCIPRLATNQRRCGQCVEYWSKAQEFYKRRRDQIFGYWDVEGAKPGPGEQPH